jgi:hypothetical protein
MDDLRVNGSNPSGSNWNIFSNYDVEQTPGFAGSVTRETAEVRLQGQPSGTYLIRSGDETSSLSVNQLMEGNHLPIQHYLLVTKGEGEQVQEHLVLHTNQGWMLYSDEPNLNTYHPARSLGNLLADLPKEYHPLTN